MKAKEFNQTHRLRETVTYFEYCNNEDEDLEKIAINRLKTICFLKPFGISFRFALVATRSLLISKPAHIVLRMHLLSLPMLKSSPLVNRIEEYWLWKTCSSGECTVGFLPNLLKANIFLKAAANRGEDYNRYLEPENIPTENQIEIDTLNFEAIDTVFKQGGFDLKLLHNLKAFDGTKKSWPEWSKDAKRVFALAGCLKVVQNKVSAKQQPWVDKALFHTLYRKLENGLCKHIVMDPINEDSGFAVWKAMENQYELSDYYHYQKLMMSLLKLKVSKPSKFLTYLASMSSIVSELESAQGIASNFRLNDDQVMIYLEGGIKIKTPYFIDLKNRLTRKLSDHRNENKGLDWREVVKSLKNSVSHEKSGINDISGKSKKRIRTKY